MNGNSSAALRDQKEKKTSFLIEVQSVEKLLWATIQCRGILHPEVQDLYHKARSGYEKIILNYHQVIDLQDIEYSLWKLHYKHIDEFRKIIKKLSGSTEGTNNLNNHVEGFKSFLSEVNQFYTDLIAKFRKSCGLFEDSLMSKNGGSSLSIEPTILQKYHYVWHRFLVCLGDLSRYRELCKKPDVQKWGVAATHYLEAAKVWPYSGNPQNQLALLATYTGDDFLALYHCIRSLAVKEPFPDARDNIMLLFEKNKSSQLKSLSTDAHIDFSKPLKRLSSQIKSHSSIDSTNINKVGGNEHIPPGKTDLWPLFVRMTSFFLVKSSFDDLPHTFASTMREFEALLALNDIELESSLEPYDQFNSSRKGPYRPLQAITILIFALQNLIKTPEIKDPNGKKDSPILQLTLWAWTFTFSFLAHLTQRCLTFKSQNKSLLPALLVFVEWYVGVLDYAETCGQDDKVINAKSYFITALVDFLNGVDVKEVNALTSESQTALWEDYELRGFEPVSKSVDSLDFSNLENKGKYESGNSIRVHRIFLASTKIVDRFKGQSTKKFCTERDFENNSESRKSNAIEEEEVILFKPLIRHNSAPIQASGETSDKTAVSDDSLRRPAAVSDDGFRQSTSSFAAQNETSKHGPPYSGGPPSLNAWVFNQETLSPKSQNKTDLTPIMEIPISPLADVTLAEIQNRPQYIAPVPSAPLLPEHEEHGILGAPPVDKYSNFSPARNVVSGGPNFVDPYRPPVFGMSSSEWLYRYTNNLNLERGNLPNSGHYLPLLGQNLAGNLRNFHGYNGNSTFDLIDKWGTPVFTNRMPYPENPSFVYRGGGGGGGGGAELRSEQPPPLLQYLKDREWQLHGESTSTSTSSYMGN